MCYNGKKGGDILKLKKYSKLIFMSFLLIISILFSSSCSFFGWGTVMPSINVTNEFENEKWLLIDNLLINKESGTVSLLKHATVEEAGKLLVTPYTYEVEFEETIFKKYTFTTSDINYGTYYKCVITYNYEGTEISHEFLSEPLTKEQAVELYETYLPIKYDFAYDIDILWDNNIESRKYKSSAEQTIVEYVENIYNSGEKSNSVNSVAVNAKPIGDEFWFSTVIFPNGHLNSGSSLLDGVNKSEIKSYDPQSGEIKMIYTHNKNNEAIIDFDETGFYTFDSNSNIKHYDMESKKSTHIYTFPYRMPATTYSAYSFDITDNYICASYEDGIIGYYYFVYEKEKGIVANDMYSKYDRMY